MGNSKSKSSSSNNNSAQNVPASPKHHHHAKSSSIPSSQPQPLSFHIPPPPRPFVATPQKAGAHSLKGRGNNHYNNNPPGSANKYHSPEKENQTKEDENADLSSLAHSPRVAPYSASKKQQPLSGRKHQHKQHVKKPAHGEKNNKLKPSPTNKAAKDNTLPPPSAALFDSATAPIKPIPSPTPAASAANAKAATTAAPQRTAVIVTNANPAAPSPTAAAATIPAPIFSANNLPIVFPDGGLPVSVPLQLVKGVSAPASAQASAANSRRNSMTGAMTPLSGDLGATVTLSRKNSDASAPASDRGTTRVVQVGSRRNSMDGSSSSSSSMGIASVTVKATSSTVSSTASSKEVSPNNKSNQAPKASQKPPVPAKPVLSASSIPASHPSSSSSAASSSSSSSSSSSFGGDAKSPSGVKSPHRSASLPPLLHKHHGGDSSSSSSVAAPPIPPRPLLQRSSSLSLMPFIPTTSNSTNAVGFADSWMWQDAHDPFEKKTVKFDLNRFAAAGRSLILAMDMTSLLQPSRSQLELLWTYLETVGAPLIPRDGSLSKVRLMLFASELIAKIMLNIVLQLKNEQGGLEISWTVLHKALMRERKFALPASGKEWKKDEQMKRDQIFSCGSYVPVSTPVQNAAIRGMMHVILKLMDLNLDGKLSRTEFLNTYPAAIKTIMNGEAKVKQDKENSGVIQCTIM